MQTVRCEKFVGGSSGSVVIQRSSAQSVYRSTSNMSKNLFLRSVWDITHRFTGVDTSATSVKHQGCIVKIYNLIRICAFGFYRWLVTTCILQWTVYNKGSISTPHLSNELFTTKRCFIRLETQLEVQNSSLAHPDVWERLCECGKNPLPGVQLSMNNRSNCSKNCYHT